MTKQRPTPEFKSMPSLEVRQAAWFRYRLRRFLRFSERVARTCGVTPQQHQLLLGVAGYTGRGWATISELAEFLQERHNAVVGLVQRAALGGLVAKRPGALDRRFVRVHLTPRGRVLLRRLTGMHLEQRRTLEAEARRNYRACPPTLAAAQGA